MIEDMNEDDHRVRTFVKGDRTYYVTQKDPYGFCHVTWDSTAKLPEVFEGVFTTFKEAEYAIELYSNSVPKNAPKKLEAKLI
jgi:hypothetical protein